MSKIDDAWNFKVSSEYGSITEKTNGSMLEVTGLDADTVISETKYIVLESDVTDGATADGFSVEAVSKEDALEVILDESDPPEQSKIRILIGAISIVTDPETSAETATAIQALFTPVRLTQGIMEGVVCLMWDAAALHPDALIPEPEAPPVP